MKPRRRKTEMAEKCPRKRDLWFKHGTGPLLSPFPIFFPSLHSFPNQEQENSKSMEDCCPRRDGGSTEECLVPTEKLMCVCLVMPAGYVYKNEKM